MWDGGIHFLIEGKGTRRGKKHVTVYTGGRRGQRHTDIKDQFASFSRTYFFSPLVCHILHGNKENTSFFMKIYTLYVNLGCFPLPLFPQLCILFAYESIAPFYFKTYKYLQSTSKTLLCFALLNLAWPEMGSWVSRAVVHWAFFFSVKSCCFMTRAWLWCFTSCMFGYV